MAETNQEKVQTIALRRWSLEKQGEKLDEMLRVMAAAAEQQRVACAADTQRMLKLYSAPLVIESLIDALADEVDRLSAQEQQS